MDTALTVSLAAECADPWPESGVEDLIDYCCPWGAGGGGGGGGGGCTSRHMLHAARHVLCHLLRAGLVCMVVWRAHGSETASKLLEEMGNPRQCLPGGKLNCVALEEEFYDPVKNLL